MSETKLGKQIKNLLYEKRMTQTELAKKSGINIQVLSNWIIGFRKPKLESLERLAKALNVPISYFLENDKNNLKKNSNTENIDLEKLNSKIDLITEKYKTLEEKNKRLELETELIKNRLEKLEK